MPLMPTMPLSNKYTLEDLTITEYSLQYPNMPDQSYYLDNLSILANVLEDLEKVIGPFKIISAFRTRELQQRLTSSGNPTSTKLSFHEIGRAVDIFPKTMSLDRAFGLILANPDLKNLFAEISIKPSQNTLHLSVNVPGDWRTPKILGLTASNTYAALAQSDIERYIASISDAASKAASTAAQAASEIFEDAEEWLSTGDFSNVLPMNKGPILLAGAVLGVGVLAYMVMSPKPKRA